MNEKEAREIFNSGPGNFSYQYAKGYLEAIEKARVLENTLIEISKMDYRGNRPIENGLAHKSLAEWRRIK